LCRRLKTDGFAVLIGAQSGSPGPCMRCDMVVVIHRVYCLTRGCDLMSGSG
jgi:hypothetical protein